MVSPRHIAISRRGAIAALGAVALASRSRASDAQTVDRYQGGGTPIEGDALIFLTQSRGYFAKAGLSVDVTAMKTGEDIAAAVAGGRIQLGGINTMSLAIAHQNGIDLKAISGGPMYLSTHSGSQMLVAKSSPYRNAKDLTGKTFATNVLHGSAQVASQAWIDKNGGDSTSVKWIEMPFSLMEAALIAGRIDAALVTQPFATTALVDCRSLGAPNDAIAPKFLNGCYMVSGSFLAEHRDVVSRMAAALRSASRWYDSDPAGSISDVAALTKQEPAILAHSVRTIFGDAVTPELLQPVINAGAKYGLLKQAFPAAELIAKF